jgi:hypothetical protein
MNGTFDEIVVLKRQVSVLASLLVDELQCGDCPVHSSGYCPAFLNNEGTCQEYIEKWTRDKAEKEPT